MIGSHTMLIASAPNWAEVVTAVGTAVLAIGVVIAVVSLRELRRDRHLQWIFEIGRRWEEHDLKASRLALRKYDESGHDLATKVQSWLEAGRPASPELTEEIELLQLLPDFFEDVALMRKFGRLDIGLVWQALSGPGQSRLETLGAGGARISQDGRRGSLDGIRGPRHGARRIRGQADATVVDPLPLASFVALAASAAGAADDLHGACRLRHTRHGTRFSDDAMPSYRASAGPSVS
jgi:hypothetical protein